jgi:hypothetical protein
MKILYVLLCSSLLTTTLQAADEPEFGWKTQMVFSLGLTQASFSNWSKGGESSLAWQGNLKSRFTNDQAGYNWDNKAKFAFGRAK